MASTSSAGQNIAGKSVQFAPAADSEDRKELEKARKNQSSWIIGASVLRLTKICAPQCLDYSSVQVQHEELACLSDCVRGLHKTNEATLRFFRDFESEVKQKQGTLLTDMAEEVANENRMATQAKREQQKRDSGYVRL